MDGTVENSTVTTTSDVDAIENGYTVSTITLSFITQSTISDTYTESSFRKTVVPLLQYFIGVISLIGNLLVVIVIALNVKMRQSLTNVYVINQSVLDGLAGLFLILTTALQGVTPRMHGIGGELYCRLWADRQPLWHMLISSTFNLLAVTLERYLAIVHPIKHRHSINSTKVAVSIVIVWLTGLFNQIGLKVLTSYVAGGRCMIMSRWPSELVQRGVGVAVILVQFFIPLSIISYCYVKMAMSLREKKVPPVVAMNSNQLQGGGNHVSVVLPRTSQEQQPEVVRENPAVSTRNARARRNIIKTLMIVSVCFTLCWIWNQTKFLLMNLGIVSTDYNSNFVVMARILVYLNSSINPIIYIVHFEQFKRSLVRLKQKFFGRRVPGTSGNIPDN